MRLLRLRAGVTSGFQQMTHPRDHTNTLTKLSIACGKQRLFQQYSVPYSASILDVPAKDADDTSQDCETGTNTSTNGVV